MLAREARQRGPHLHSIDYRNRTDEIGEHGTRRNTMIVLEYFPGWGIRILV